MKEMLVSSPKKSTLLGFLKKHVISSIFILGFAFDIFILPDVDHFFTIILGTSYILLFSLCLFLRELLIRNNKVDDEEKETYRVLTFLISFFSGSSLSYIFTYSLRSADFGLSAPFLLLFFIVLISNEIISSHRFRLLFDYVLLVIASSFYNIYMMPLVTGAFDDQTFYISVFSSALIIYFYTSVFSHYSEFSDLIKPKGNALAFSLPLCIFFLALNFLLPPVPFTIQKINLSIKRFSIEKEKTFNAKLFSLGEDKILHLPAASDESLSYTTVYTLPSGVISSPVHVWSKQSGDGSYTEVDTLSSSENNTFQIRSLTSKISGEKGSYRVITKVGRRVIREDDIILE